MAQAKEGAHALYGLGFVWDHSMYDFLDLPVFGPLRTIRLQCIRLKDVQAWGRNPIGPEHGYPNGRKSNSIAADSSAALETRFPKAERTLVLTAFFLTPVRLKNGLTFQIVWNVPFHTLGKEYFLSRECGAG